MSNFGDFEAATERPEYISEQYFNDYIAGVGNHEAKLITTAIILASPGLYFSKESLLDELVHRQGDEPGWVPSVMIPFQYCSASLEPVGAVIKGHMNDGKGRLINAYTADRQHLEANLALTGCLLDWSVRYPDMSVQSIFSSTASSGEVRAPIARYRILSELLTANESLSVVDLVQAVPDLAFSKPDVSMARHLRVMERANLVVTNSNYFGKDIELTVVDPEYKAWRKPLEECSLETQATYFVMNDVYAQGETIHLADFVASMVKHNPAIDPLKARAAILGAIKGDGRFKGLAAVNNVNVGQRKTAVQINEAAQQPLEDLINGLESLRSGKHLAEYMARAVEIISNPGDCAQLMRKAKEFSPYTKRTDASKNLTQFILDTVSNGSASAGELQNMAKERLEREVSVDSLRQIARTLINEGKLVVSESQVRYEQGMKRVVKVYSLPKND